MKTTGKHSFLKTSTKFSLISFPTFMGIYYKRKEEGESAQEEQVGEDGEKAEVAKEARK